MLSILLDVCDYVSQPHLCIFTNYFSSQFGDIGEVFVISSFAPLWHIVFLVTVGVLSQCSAVAVRVLLSPSGWCLGMRSGCSETFSGEMSVV